MSARVNFNQLDSDDRHLIIKIDRAFPSVLGGYLDLDEWFEVCDKIDAALSELEVYPRLVSAAKARFFIVTAILTVLVLAAGYVTDMAVNGIQISSITEVGTTRGVFEDMETFYGSIAAVTIILMGWCYGRKIFTPCVTDHKKIVQKVFRGLLSTVEDLNSFKTNLIFNLMQDRSNFSGSTACVVTEADCDALLSTSNPLWIQIIVEGFQQLSVIVPPPRNHEGAAAGAAPATSFDEESQKQEKNILLRFLRMNNFTPSVEEIEKAAATTRWQRNEQQNFQNDDNPRGGVVHHDTMDDASRLSVVVGEENASEKTSPGAAEEKFQDNV